MATETVIYVSLALVLLTRIYVFINPPDFLEEHKDRRYHEYHLYRQYHLHKQYSNEEDGNGTDARSTDNDQPSLLTSDGVVPFRQRQERKNSTGSLGSTTAGLETLHSLSDELVLLGMGPGSQPFPLHELSTETLSKLDTSAATATMAVAASSSSSTFSPSSVTSPRREQDLWKQIIFSNEAKSVPNFLSLDISEIHYNGPLKEKFDSDKEVQRAIQELQNGQREMAQECPVMTVVWEGGRWCCLEGRSLYIMRAMAWKGQVRVRVLVDKDPTLLAVTEDCWRAAGMTTLDSSSFSSPSSSSIPSTSLPTESILASSSRMASPMAPLTTSKVDRTPFSAATAQPNTAVDQTVSLGLGLDEDLVDLHHHLHFSSSFQNDGDDAYPRTLSKVRFSVLAAEQQHLPPGQLSQRSLPGSPTGHDADDEKDDDDDDLEDENIESDGYMEDDEEDTEDEGDLLLSEARDTFDSRTAPLPPTGFGRRLQIDPRPSRPERKGTRVLALPSRLVIRPPLSTFSTCSSSSTLVSTFSAVTIQDEDEANNSDLTVVSPPQSPMLLPIKQSSVLSSSLSVDAKAKAKSFGRQESSNLFMKSSTPHHHHHHHERKISIPEFLLPPPQFSEQEYLILDPNSDSARRDNPPRRDSGHGDTP